MKTNMDYLTLGVAAALATLRSGAACADDETIAVFTKNLTNPYFQAVRVGAETAAKALGAKVHPIHPDQAGQHSRAAQPGRGRRS